MTHPLRITSNFSDFTNGVVVGQEGFMKPSELTENDRKLMIISQILCGQIKLK